MYTQYWNLKQRPFEPGRNLHFHYSSSENQATLQKVRYLLEMRRAIVLLTGPAGVGKREWAEQLTESSHRFQPVWRLCAAPLDAENFLYYLADRIAGETEFKNNQTGDETDQNELERTAPFRAFRTVEREIYAAGQRKQRPLLVIEDADESHDEEFWPLLKGLAGISGTDGPLLSILLLADTVPNSPGFTRFEPYLETIAPIEPLSLDETVDYVTFRLAQAGAESEIFTAEALATVFHLTGGIPLQINRLCDMALLIGSVEQWKTIDDAAVEAVYREMVPEKQISSLLEQ